MKPPKFRVFDPPKKVPGVLIEGRVPTRWMIENDWKISKADFYNQELTEDDLKAKYGGK